MNTLLIVGRKKEILCFKTRHYDHTRKSVRTGNGLMLIYRATMPIKSGISDKALWKR